MITYVPGFHSFFRFFGSFCIGQIITTSSIRDTMYNVMYIKVCVTWCFLLFLGCRGCQLQAGARNGAVLRQGRHQDSRRPHSEKRKFTLQNTLPSCHTPFNPTVCMVTRKYYVVLQNHWEKKIRSSIVKYSCHTLLYISFFVYQSVCVPCAHFTELHVCHTQNVTTLPSD